MDDDYVVLSDLVKTPQFGTQSWFDYFTIWSVVLFFLTLIMILIDQFHPFLPGWWIAFMFANMIGVGIMGTLIVTINADRRGAESAKIRLEYAYSQLFFHTVPMLIALLLLLLFPTILKNFQVWQVIVAFIVIFLLYLVVPTTNGKKMFISKIRQIYINPNLFLLFTIYIGVLALIIYIEKRLIYMYQ